MSVWQPYSISRDDNIVGEFIVHLQAIDDGLGMSPEWLSDVAFDFLQGHDDFWRATEDQAEQARKELMTASGIEGLGGGWVTLQEELDELKGNRTESKLELDAKDIEVINRHRASMGRDPIDPGAGWTPQELADMAENIRTKGTEHNPGDKRQASLFDEDEEDETFALTSPEGEGERVKAPKGHQESLFDVGKPDRKKMEAMRKRELEERAARRKRGKKNPAYAELKKRLMR